MQPIALASVLYGKYEIGFYGNLCMEDMFFWSERRKKLKISLTENRFGDILTTAEMVSDIKKNHLTGNIFSDILNILLEINIRCQRFCFCAPFFP